MREPGIVRLSPFSARLIVREENRHRITIRFEAINRRAARHGLPPVRLTWTPAEPLIIRNEITGRVTITDQAAVTFEGSTPTFAGWHLQAAIDRVEGSSILRTVPGAPPVPEHYRTADRCDVCRTSRKRTTLYLCRHDDGRTQIVGSDCLSLLLPGADPASLIFALDYLAEIAALGDDDGEGSEGRGESATALVELLTSTAEVLTLDPWISRTQARDTGRSATADLVDRYRYGTSVASREYQSEVRAAVAGRDFAPEAEAAAEWAANVEPSSDYLYNVRTLAGLGWVRDRHKGIAVSILHAYRRHVAETTAPTGPGDYLGKIGERLRNIRATLDAVHTYETFYGTKAVIKLRTDDGSQLVSFTSPITEAPGTRFKLAGTVKKHETYKGTKQTIIARMTLAAV